MGQEVAGVGVALPPWQLTVRTEEIWHSNLTMSCGTITVPRPSMRGVEERFQGGQTA